MSEFGDISDKQFQDFAKRVGDEVKTKGMLKKATNRMNIVANYTFRNVVKMTPTKTGTLKRGWSRSDVRYVNDEIVVKISNDVNYASFVENGHRTVNGKNWVEGQFMAKKSLAMTEENKLNKTMHKELDGYLSKLLGG
ncbi:HK97 gp10 family phage protein [Apilactobacillus timberlakei]|uniref:HK97 gp10 family phage protein n=1 Tax=Apilactobacillus timberlakei TaxID=2008380 RepID=A0ABY2YSB8_9LACO|nr:HK97 gp10 family phage protein [Apilactobacillus timberlakei]TPR12394.1 HK97 gp10 family phage protein [Apilactobacillus timberlakei]TPR12980.1 HK97 gp10 family phage protein [Apilactobacillus timberlakei]